MKAKFLNVVYIINKIWYAITVILFVTVIFGFLAEMVLGGIQVLSSLLMLIYWNQYSKKQQQRLYKYWLVVGVYFLLWLGNWEVMPFELIAVVGVGVIPMGIGFYFMMLLRDLKQPTQTELIEELGYETV